MIHSLSRAKLTACRGGWPASISLGTEAAQEYARAYLEEVCRADVPQLGTTRSTVRLSRLRTAMATLQAGTAENAALREGYESAVERLAWYPDDAPDFNEAIEAARSLTPPTSGI